MLLELVWAPQLSVLLPPSPDARGPQALDDRALARSVDAEYLAQKPFVPLPVLGVPGWCADNAAADFYDDPKVFRPGP